MPDTLNPPFDYRPAGEGHWQVVDANLQEAFVVVGDLADAMRASDLLNEDQRRVEDLNEDSIDDAYDEGYDKGYDIHRPWTGERMPSFRRPLLSLTDLLFAARRRLLRVEAIDARWEAYRCDVRDSLAESGRWSAVLRKGGLN